MFCIFLCIYCICVSINYVCITIQTSKTFIVTQLDIVQTNDKSFIEQTAYFHSLCTRTIQYSVKRKLSKILVIYQMGRQTIFVVDTEQAASVMHIVVCMLHTKNREQHRYRKQPETRSCQGLGLPRDSCTQFWCRVKNTTRPGNETVHSRIFNRLVNFSFFFFNCMIVTLSATITCIVLAACGLMGLEIASVFLCMVTS